MTLINQSLNLLLWLPRWCRVHVEIHEGWVEHIVGEGQWRVGEEFQQVMFLKEVAQVLEEAHVRSFCVMFCC
jgi:hypothetical protein